MKPVLDASAGEARHQSDEEGGQAPWIHEITALLPTYCVALGVSPNLSVPHLCHLKW